MPDLKLIIEKLRQKAQENHLFFKFKTALEEFNEDTIKECLNAEFKLANYERCNGSSIISLLHGFEKVALNYAKNYSPKYIDYFCNNISSKDLEELDPKYQNFYILLQDKMLELIKLLHTKGASINAVMVESEDLSSIFNAVSGKRVVEKGPSPIKVIVNCSNLLKTDKIINWLLQQNGLIKDFDGLVETTVRWDNNIGTAVLASLLEAGAPIKDTPTMMPGLNSNPLVLCLLHSEKTLRDKLEILTKYANDEMVNEFKDNYEEAILEKFGSLDGKIKL